jgi:excisionase family DNA binding protein
MTVDTSPTPLLLSVAETARLLGLSDQTLRNWSSRNKLPIPSVRVGGRRLFRRADVETYVAGLVPPPPDPAPQSSCPRRGRPRKGVRS